MNLHRKRPVQIILLLIIHILGMVLPLIQFLFYTSNQIVYDSSLLVTASQFPIYLWSLLAFSGVYLILFILLLLGVKAAFWIDAIFLSLNLLSQLLTFNLFSILIAALYVWLIFCTPSRAYFRIGKYAQSK